MLKRQTRKRNIFIPQNEKCDTLMDMRTDLIAVPHAGLGFQFLRVQVMKPKKGRGGPSSGGPRGFRWPATPKENTDRADDKVTTYVQKSQVHHRCSSPSLKETTK